VQPGIGAEQGTGAKANAHFSPPVHKTSRRDREQGGSEAAAQLCFPQASLEKILPKIPVAHMLQLPPKQLCFSPAGNVCASPML